MGVRSDGLFGSGQACRHRDKLGGELVVALREGRANRIPSNRALLGRSHDSDARSGMTFGRDKNRISWPRPISNSRVVAPPGNGASDVDAVWLSEGPERD